MATKTTLQTWAERRAIIPPETAFLPFHVPEIGEEDIRAVSEVLRSGWITSGPMVREFEEAFARYVGAKHALAVNSGTAALHLALKAAGVGPGDEVVLPAMTFAATAEVVTYLSAEPVLVDSTPGAMNLDLNKVERAITPRTKAILPVHFGGHPCEMDRLLAIAKKRRIPVIEDAAHALPARYRGKTVGTMGEITCFSFYATKSITTGEGGMVTTENAGYAERMRKLSLHGLSQDAWNRYDEKGSWRYDICEAGFKYNLGDIQAALGLSQLKKCDAMWWRRSMIAAKYTRALAGIDAFQVPRSSAHVQHAWHLYVIRLNPAAMQIGRDRVIEELRKQKIGTSVHFIPLHLHSYYQREWGYRRGDFPVAEQYFDTCISLPIYPGMSDENVQRVIDCLAEIAATYRR
ncbi:MAG: DegT/DnrJ/EryC1/StrS family aminotransferase [Candidatus Acidiferrales bacterium]